MKYLAGGKVKQRFGTTKHAEVRLVVTTKADTGDGSARRDLVHHPELRGEKTNGAVRTGRGDEEPGGGHGTVGDHARSRADVG
eukprot:CAMPEP_0119150840 /NCGR_PEP_ID=MMETSP1310-20130426/45452_1 /TAXON_ID=464262 /ORGANISM="Genus nov. species nov., Strain RCC2339" /LENGTH=82 /DNA_ID=CAMNT_0007143067 /DNA_START=238 /DNA_END=483 /DNA_ORIENTATION=-